ARVFTNSPIVRSNGRAGREPTMINNGAAATSAMKRFVLWPTNGRESFIDAGKTIKPTMSLSTSRNSNYVVQRWLSSFRQQLRKRRTVSFWSQRREVIRLPSRENKVIVLSANL